MGLVKADQNAEKGEGLAPPHQLETLLVDLAAPEASRRRAAARALADHPTAAAALCDQLEIETAVSVRAVILTSLIRLQSPAIGARLAGLLRSDDAALRNAALEALQGMPKAVAPHLDALLADPDPDVRLFAVNILAELHYAPAPDWLLRVIREETHVNVCAAAVDGLAECGTPEMIADLERLRERFSDYPFMAFAVETAIRRIRGT